MFSMTDLCGYNTALSTVILPLNSLAKMRNDNRMGMKAILDRIDGLRGDLSDNELAQRAGLSRDGIRNWRRKVRAGDNSVSATVKNLSSIAHYLNVSETWLIHGTGDGPQLSTIIPVPGHVGAGDQVDMVNPYAEGDGMYYAACPPQLSPHDVVALEIRGQSMEPTYLDGGLIFYSREALGVPTEALGRICVAEDEKENIWLKQVKPGSAPGLFHLISINPTSLNLHDIRLTWASPIRFYLPPDMVERLERG